MAETDRQQVSARKGFFPLVAGGDVRVQEAGGVAFLARRNLALSRGGGQWLIAGGDQHIEQGGGAMLLSRQARVTNGFVGVLIAGRVTLEGSARALVNLAPRAALAAALGFSLGYLVGRHGPTRAS